jgi:hypothetical protein
MEMDLRKTVPNLPDPSKLIFGHMFTDHMLSINWNAKTGCKFESLNFYGVFQWNWHLDKALISVKDRH